MSLILGGGVGGTRADYVLRKFGHLFFGKLMLVELKKVVS